MKLLTAMLGTMMFCSLAHSQQPQSLTPQEKQKQQEEADALIRAADALTNLANATNGVVNNTVRQCVATGVIRSKCECLAYNIPIGIAEDREIWGDVGRRTPWVAYVSLITLDMPESEILAQLKTSDAKKIVKTTFRARYKCT
jgi:hypothetical protein